MAKQRQSYICTNCQSHFSQWSGRCPVCHEWNTIVEEEPTESFARPSAADAVPAQLVSVKELPKGTVVRISSGIAEFDRVLGGDTPGIVPGSVMLMAGTPGVGKSTLLLQVASSIDGALYFSAEESLEQLRLRAIRLGITKSQLELSTERNINKIIAAIAARKPPFVVIDSIQTVFDETISGTPGSLVQVRETGWRLQQFAKQTGTAILLVGHVTKEGVVAGPKVLEHLVDVVMYLEGEKRTGLRLLRCDKNRFGSTEEVGIWQLTGEGYQPVADPGKLFATIITENVPGRALSVTLEGTRAFLVEIQALLTKTAFGYPKRTAQGIDVNRLNLLLAVLENRLDLPLSQYDVFINVVGGFTIKDPGIDLALSAAIISGLTKKALPTDQVFIGEIGLLGEVRPAFEQSRRKKEVSRLGYTLASELKTIKQLPRILA